jgi:hypothetical protein
MGYQVLGERSVITGSELHAFDHGSHMSHQEETDRFVALAADFLERAEASLTLPDQRTSTPQVAAGAV